MRARRFSICRRICHISVGVGAVRGRPAPGRAPPCLLFTAILTNFDFTDDFNIWRGGAFRGRVRHRRGLSRPGHPRHIGGIIDLLHTFALPCRHDREESLGALRGGSALAAPYRRPRLLKRRQRHLERVQMRQRFARNLTRPAILAGSSRSARMADPADTLCRSPWGTKGARHAPQLLRPDRRTRAVPETAWHHRIAPVGGIRYAALFNRPAFWFGLAAPSCAVIRASLALAGAFRAPAGRRAGAGTT